MNQIRKRISSPKTTWLLKIASNPMVIFLLIIVAYFWEIFLKNYVPVATDVLVGSYFPWLEHKWDYIVGVPVKNVQLSDVFSQFFVWKYLAIDMIKHGKWPLWNYYSFSGTPLLANFHSGSLFPANILFLLPKYWGWSLYIMLSHFVAAIGMYVYLGTYIKSKIPRISAGVIYSFAGQMTMWSEFGTAVWAAAMIPLVLWSIDRVVDSKNLKHLIAISLFTGLTVLAGHVQLLTYLIVLVPIYGLWKVKSTQNFHLKTLIQICAAFGLGLGLAALQLLPTIDLFNYSIRAEEKYTSSGVAFFGLTPIIDLIRLWAADFFGNPVTGNDFSKVGYLGFSSYLGAITIPMISGLLFVNTKKLVKFFLGLLLVIFFLAIKHPISTWLYTLPIPLLTYSSATRLFFLVNLAASILLAASFNYLQNSKYIRYVRGTALVLIGLTLIGWLFIDLEFRVVSIRNSAIPIFILLTLIIITKILYKRKILVFFLLIILVIDLGRFYRKFNTYVPERLVFPSTPAIEYIKNQPGIFRIARQRGPILPANSWTFYRLEAIEGYDALRLLSYNRLFHLIETGEYLSAGSRYSEVDDHVNSKFLDALNVKYFWIVNEPYYQQKPTIKELTDHGFTLVFEEGRTQIYENPHVLPRAYSIAQVVYAQDERHLADLMQHPGFDPRNQAVILEKISYDLTKLGKVTVSDPVIEPNRMKFEVSAYQDSFLIISSAYDTGWKARVENQPLKVYRVNGGLMGVMLSRGRHELVLEYFPDSFRLGLIISGISLTIILISYSFFSRKKLTS